MSGCQMNVLTKQVIETSYLTAPSAAQYRVILRFFYEQHERMRDYIAPEEVLHHMRTFNQFENFDEEQLHQNLAQLVLWNNLVARQDMTKARTVEEYKKKRFRYQPTPYTIEIERMLIKLESIVDNTFSGSLESSQFERLLQALQSLEDKSLNIEQQVKIWEDIVHYFNEIRRNTADYIAYINSEKIDQRMLTEAFLVYKTQFSHYLRNFIVSLQQTSLQIIELLQNKSIEHTMLAVFDSLITKEKIHDQIAGVIVSDDSRLKSYQAKFESIKRWFLETDGQKSELEMLQWQTNEMIRRVTRYVQRLGERQHYFKSRQNDYLQLAKWFSECPTIVEAHEISAIVFGAMQTQHVQLKTDTTDDLYSDTWSEKPEKIVIKPRTNRYREKTKATGIALKETEKRAQREKYLSERRQQELLVKNYFKHGTVQLSKLSVIEPFMRKLLLTWMSKARTSDKNLITTEFGTLLRITMLEEKTTLRAQDGDLLIQDALFEYVKEA